MYNNIKSKFMYKIIVKPQEIQINEKIDWRSANLHVAIAFMQCALIETPNICFVLVKLFVFYFRRQFHYWVILNKKFQREINTYRCKLKIDIRVEHRDKTYIERERRTTNQGGRK